MRQLRHNDIVGTKAVTECSTGRFRSGWEVYINPLNAELNPVCHLLALLGAHPILHISKIRVKMDPTQLGIENHR